MGIVQQEHAVSDRSDDEMDWEAESNGVIIVQPPAAGSPAVQFGRRDSLEVAQIAVLQPHHPEPEDVAQGDVIAINMNDFHDLPLPIEEGTSTTVGIEWEQCTVARQYVYGHASLLPGIWEVYDDLKGVACGGSAKTWTARSSLALEARPVL